MYFVCSDKDPPIAHASLATARATLRGELSARQEQGYAVRFNDRLEYELSRDGAPPSLTLWIEDDAGQRVVSQDAAEAG